MVFEIGKIYRHTSGQEMAIVGKVKTTMYGETLVGERADMADLQPVGQDEDAAENWSEITEGEWLGNFTT